MALGLATIAWISAVIFTLISLIKPLRPFQSRLQTVGIGAPALIAGLIIIAGATPPKSAVGTVPSTRAVGVTEPVAQAVGDKAMPVIEVAERKGTSQPMSSKGPIMAPTTNVEAPTPQISALTHFNKGIDKRVTYRGVQMYRIDKIMFDADVWTIPDNSTDVICFPDGNNAVFFTMGGDFYAANGKARQFVRFEENDGIILADGTLRPVREVPPGEHVKLVHEIIQIGLQKCGQKSLEEISDAVNQAVDEPPSSDDDPKTDALILAGLLLRGADYCRFTLDTSALGLLLVKAGIDKETAKAELPAYVALAGGLITAGPDTFCGSILAQYGPRGTGYLTE